MPSKYRNDQTSNQRKTNSSGKLRIFYILMLLLTIFSLVLRVSGGRQNTPAQAAGGTAARALVFHLEEDNLCEDLTITSTGSAIFSNCGRGVEEQYALNSSERAQLQTWIEKYSAVNYDRSTPVQSGTSKTQLYLNGRGHQQANEAEVQQLITFAKSLASKTVSPS